MPTLLFAVIAWFIFELEHLMLQPPKPETSKVFKIVILQPAETDQYHLDRALQLAAVNSQQSLVVTRLISTMPAKLYAELHRTDPAEAILLITPTTLDTQFQLLKIPIHVDVNNAFSLHTNSHDLYKLLTITKSPPTKAPSKNSTDHP